MTRTCEDCGRQYDDFNHWTFCPHDYFEPSDDAKMHLTQQGIDWRTGERL